MSTIAPTTAGSSLLNTLSATPASTTVGAQANDAQMNQFLTLLTAQLKNQDPMQPTDPTQFVAQLAQFSTVEQLVQGNTKLDTISQSLSGLALGQYSGLISHTVAATATTTTVPDSGSPAQMAYHVTAPSLTGIHVEITDASGNLVRTIPVTSTDGTIAFDGNGTNGHASSHWAIQRRDGRTDDSGRVAIGRDAEHQREGDWRDAGRQRQLAASARRWPHG